MILDADILIDLKRGLPSALEWLSAQTEYPTVSGLAAMEITFGSQSYSELREVQEFLRPFPILWPENRDMARALSLASLKLSHGTGILDALTAALAIGCNMPPATFNIKHFRMIPELITSQPYMR